MNKTKFVALICSFFAVLVFINTASAATSYTSNWSTFGVTIGQTWSSDPINGITTTDVPKLHKVATFPIAATAQEIGYPILMGNSMYVLTDTYYYNVTQTLSVENINLSTGKTVWVSKLSVNRNTLFLPSFSYNHNRLYIQSQGAAYIVDSTSGKTLKTLITDSDAKIEVISGRIFLFSSTQAKVYDQNSYKLLGQTKVSNSWYPASDGKNVFVLDSKNMIHQYDLSLKQIRTIQLPFSANTTISVSNGMLIAVLQRGMVYGYTTSGQNKWRNTALAFSNGLGAPYHLIVKNTMMLFPLSVYGATLLDVSTGKSRVVHIPYQYSNGAFAANGITYFTSEDTGDVRLHALSNTGIALNLNIHVADPSDQYYIIPVGNKTLAIMDNNVVTLFSA